MGIDIFANKYIDIMLAGGLMLLLLSFTTGNQEAQKTGFDLIFWSALIFIAYLLIKHKPWE